MRHIGKVLFLLFVIALFIAGGTLAFFKSWRNQRIEQLDKASSIADTIMGKVEFVLKGDGPLAVLVFHGAPGGYDQALLLGENLSKAGYQILAPSRPGYLRTPITTGRTAEEQADAMAALIATIGGKKVAVLGFSLGCPVAVQFAIRHPDLVWAVALVSTPVTEHHPARSVPQSLVGNMILNKSYSDLESWLLVEESEYFPEKSLLRMLACESTLSELQREKIAVYTMSNRGQFDWYRSLLLSTAPMSIRQEGYTNDGVLLRAHEPLRFKDIQAPLLIIQGANNADFPAEELKKALVKVPAAELMTIEDSGTLVWLGPNGDSVTQKILTFLQTNAPANSQ